MEITPSNKDSPCYGSYENTSTKSSHYNNTIGSEKFKSKSKNNFCTDNFTVLAPENSKKYRKFHTMGICGQTEFENHRTSQYSRLMTTKERDHLSVLSQTPSSDESEIVNPKEFLAEHGLNSRHSSQNRNDRTFENGIRISIKPIENSEQNS